MSSAVHIYSLIWMEAESESILESEACILSLIRQSTLPPNPELHASISQSVSWRL